MGDYADDNLEMLWRRMGVFSDPPERQPKTERDEELESLLDDLEEEETPKQRRQRETREALEVERARRRLLRKEKLRVAKEQQQG